ncbi:MAG: antibiotic biosynthesis monooxygenase [Cobetia sp.]|jgi:antibiotic biosynthesis monooxygenase (ABM) superfamily enzyme|uniref:Antibiotic biosynthesis monooxygenase n=1 Tax=Cobetia amphilecti TaxID=1055104 RepID=A0AAP4X2M5_9GAMM|nr:MULTISPECIES: antibiotic biosynthesis monooxygenase [Cobetia]AVV33660.1 antibiotic biosynthesis monooxygenase [Halomonas sp. SF2003]MBR9756183.1 antibiotic biosynthesis monooxygenase [Gammaproteobacteria bacterium]TCJ24984.1 antibiotic biosynthesis monooxygenase [Halomonas sp. GDM18]KGA01455.1 hypothetical protein KP05_13045 [Cobetia amphilecti]KPM82189.1 hypothetical protein AOG28_02310 [Cobetia sp. UCD-24C]|tara:strand:+ start:416 stop:700 length:285 start_codon:yes stop_codon:yes gene_type:complete
MIKVLIERHIMPGLEQDYEQASREVVREATHVPGFISGENLMETGRAGHRILITSWRDARAWQEWSVSPARDRMMARLAPMLSQPERIILLEHT